MKSAILGAAAFIALAIPAASFAATYEYVGTNGTLETITANTAAQALSSALDIAPHSGVLLLAPTSTMTSSSTMMTTGMGVMGVGTSTASSSMMTASSSSMTATSTSSMMNASSTSMTNASTSAMTASTTSTI